MAHQHGGGQGPRGQGQQHKFAFKQMDGLLHAVDLTHAFDETTIYWPTCGSHPFHYERIADGKTDRGYYYSAAKFSTYEHGGTHIDAPVHFAENHIGVDKIPLQSLIGSGIVVDVSAKCAANRDYLVCVDDFRQWEDMHGRIPDGTIILLRTGFGAFYPCREKYLGTSDLGTEAVPKLSFPGLDPKAAEWLVVKRRLRAIGLDTASIDYGKSTDFEAHRVLLGNDVPVFENVASLDKLPAKDFIVFALPMKLKDGTGGPVRIVALLKRIPHSRM